MSDYDDYENNLAFSPAGDWSDRGITGVTDRTQQCLEFVEMYKKLVEENNYLKAENARLKKFRQAVRRINREYWRRLAEEAKRKGEAK